ncbi:MAG: Ig-like domain-containing protein, partial [Candidatus Moraniibacteriota bacterium]
MFRKIRRLLWLSIFFIIFSFYNQPVSAADLYTIDVFEVGDGTTLLRKIDPSTFETLETKVVAIESGENMHGDAAVNGASVDTETGEVYIITRLEGFSGRHLARLDVITGLATIIGELGDKFASIAFDGNGQLYGLTGDGADVPASLYTINKDTAETTLLATYLAENDGEALTYNSDDGFFYRATGDDLYAIDVDEPENLVTILEDDSSLSGITGLFHREGNDFYYMNWEEIYDLDSSTSESASYIASVEEGTRSMFEWEMDPSMLIVNSFHPEDNEANISVGENLTITFNREVYQGTGNVIIKNSSDDSEIESFDISSDRILGWGTDTITINPTDNLSLGGSLYVNIDETAIKSSEEIFYAGISNDMVWNFHTEGAISITEFQITNDDPVSQSYPSIYGNKIVWVDYRNAVPIEGGEEGMMTNTDIFMYDLDTQVETQITTDVSNQYYPVIYGNKIVWEDDRNGGYSAKDIYMYDLDTQIETQITTDGDDQGYPAIYGNKIVWQDNRNGNYDIYMYDLETQAETRITTNSYDQYNPAIYKNKVVWEDRRSTPHIYMYDLDTQIETQITTDESGQYSPEIYGNKVVWNDYRNGNSDIYMHDLETQTETQITIDELDQANPKIYGNFIVWEDYREGGGNVDVYMYDIISQEESQITSDISGQYNPFVYRDKIVWGDLRNGDGDIYMADLTIRTDATHYQFSEGFDDDMLKDESETNGVWDINNGIATMETNPWTHADGVTEGMEALTDGIPEGDYSNGGGAGEIFKTSMAVDSNGNPMIVWRALDGTDEVVRFAIWNGTAWTGMDGSANYQDLNADSSEISFLDIILDANNNPQVIWTRADGSVYFSKWNGVNWTYADETTLGAENISGASPLYWDSMAMLKADNDGNPVIAWGSSIGNNLHFVRWSGSSWTHADGTTPDSEIIGVCDYFDFKIDGNNNPEIVYEGANGIMFTRWNGSNWTYADGSTVGSQLISLGLSSHKLPKIELDNNDRPYVVWNISDTNAGFSNWNGSAWTRADGATLGYETLSEMDSPRIILDYQERPVIYGIDDLSGEYSLIRWNGSGWTNADGVTIGMENFADPSSSSSGNFEMIANSNEDKLYFLWNSYSMYSTHFTTWNGENWSSADEKILGDESLSGDHETYNSKLVMLSDFSSAYTMWFHDEDGGDDGIRFTKYDFNQTPSTVIQSIEIDETSENIISATLTADDETPGASDIEYFLSNNGGADWEETVSGIAHTFMTTGNDLRWRAILYRGSAPVIDSLDIIYSFEEEAVQYTLTYTPGPNGTIDGDTSQTINEGDDGTEVTAVPDPGYRFVDWSDLSTENPRMDENVTGDINVTANFEEDIIPTPTPTPEVTPTPEITPT